MTRELTRKVCLLSEPGVEGPRSRDENITDSVTVVRYGGYEHNGYLSINLLRTGRGGNTATVTRTVTVVGNRSVDLNASGDGYDLVSARHFYHGQSDDGSGQGKRIVKTSIMSR